MPKRWTIQAGIIALGAVVAVGTLQRGTYVPQTPLVQRLAAGDSAAQAKLGSLVAATAPAAKPTSLAVLDTGLSHPRIDYWIHRLTTNLSDGFETSLARMDKYADMISSKLAAKDMPQD